MKSGLLLVLIVALILLVAIDLTGVSVYNSLITKEQAVDSAWAQVQNVYQRRADLIPNLVATVSGAANFEKSTLTEITAARGSEALEPMAAFGKETRILFQGDSITDGNRGRSADPNHILGHGYAFIIAAKFGAGYAERKLTFINRGISGNTVLDLEKRWQKDTLDLKPDVLSVLIGVNDNSKGVPVEQFEQVYDKLLTVARAANPKLKLVLCEPIGMPLGAKKAIFATWFPVLQQRQAIVAKLAQKHGAALVRFQKVFDDASRRVAAEHWNWDGVHPTYSGHQLMADEWGRTVNAFWPATK